MLTFKQEALHTINQLPNNVDIDEIIYQIYVLNKIQKGQKAIEQNETLTSEQLQQEIESW